MCWRGGGGGGGGTTDEAVTGITCLVRGRGSFFTRPLTQTHFTVRQFTLLRLRRRQEDTRGPSLNRRVVSLNTSLRSSRGAAVNLGHQSLVSVRRGSGVSVAPWQLCEGN